MLALDVTPGRFDRLLGLPQGPQRKRASSRFSPLGGYRPLWASRRGDVARRADAHSSSMLRPSGMPRATAVEGTRPLGRVRTSLSTSGPLFIRPGRVLDLNQDDPGSPRQSGGKQRNEPAQCAVDLHLPGLSNQPVTPPTGVTPDDSRAGGAYARRGPRAPRDGSGATSGSRGRRTGRARQSSVQPPSSDHPVPSSIATS